MENNKVAIWKKILVILGILAFVGLVTVGVTTCGILKLTGDWVKEKEPELLEYVKMNEVEQNIYVENHIDELFRRIDVYAEKNESDVTAEEKTAWKNFENDVEAKTASLQLGRSLVAALIMSSENITKGLSAEDKEKYEKESELLSERTEIYKNLLEKYFPKK